MKNRNIVRGFVALLVSVLCSGVILGGCATNSRSVAKAEVKEKVSTKRPIPRVHGLNRPPHAPSTPYEVVLWRLKHKKKKSRKVVEASAPSPAKKKTVSRKSSGPRILSPRQARLTPSWNTSAFKYIAIDGFRYSADMIQGYLDSGDDDSIFQLGGDGTLYVSLNESFVMEIGFYPPGTDGHNDFNPFNVVIVNQKGQTVTKENVGNRLEACSIAM